MTVKDVIGKIYCNAHLWIEVKGNLKLVANEQTAQTTKFADWKVEAIDCNFPLPGIGLLVKRA